MDLRLDSALPAEGYTLVVAPQRITIAGGAGRRALRRPDPALVAGPAPVAGGTDIPCVSIRDQPRFAWRGLMLDCSRTFQSLDYLRKTIDRLAFYKMNVLHLHLTDDQGWRVEIKKIPNSRRKAPVSRPVTRSRSRTRDSTRRRTSRNW